MFSSELLKPRLTIPSPTEHGEEMYSQALSWGMTTLLSYDPFLALSVIFGNDSQLATVHAPSLSLPPLLYSLSLSLST